MAWRPYNSDVGRLRIKKKEAVIPFRETLAYRMILLAASVIAFFIALYITIGAFQIAISAASISSAVIDSPDDQARSKAEVNPARVAATAVS